MILITEKLGLLGPFDSIVLGEDRAYCDENDVPYTVVGKCSILDVALPFGANLANYEAVDGHLVLKVPPPAEE